MADLPIQSDGMIFYTLDYEDGRWISTKGIPYYVASPFNYLIYELAPTVVAFIHHSCPENMRGEFLQKVKDELGL